MSAPLWLNLKNPGTPDAGAPGGTPDISFAGGDEVVAALASPVRKTYRRLELIKEILNSDLIETLEVTDDVHQWGVIQNRSTIAEVDWQVPSLTAVIRNESQVFSEWLGTSWWQSEGVSRIPTECWLRFTYELLYRENTKREVLLTYTGKIQNAYHRYDGTLAVVELETTLAADEGLGKNCLKSSGYGNQYLWGDI